MHRDYRFGEKLATPDTSIADLIGEVDPIKVAEGRYLSDELTLHYGLVPRTNRGIFAINELPDLAERIQVGLLNVLEERDVQIRGYKIRLPLDVMLVASANPEDYTNRGRIITPLKDRFGAQIRTHYPLDVDDRDRGGRTRRRVPFAGTRRAGRGAAATWPRSWRPSPSWPARARTSTSAPGCRCASASPTTRRWWPARSAGPCGSGETEAVPRISDLDALASSTSGKVEIETIDEGRDGQVVERLIQQAVLTVFKAPRALRAPARRGRRLRRRGRPGGAHRRRHPGRPVRRGPRPAARPARAWCSGLAGEESPAAVASATEFVLEGLHLAKRLNKDAAGSRATYRAR